MPGNIAYYGRDKRESQRSRYPVESTLDGGFQSVGPGLVGSLFSHSNLTDDFDKLLQRINRPMPARGSKRGRMAPSRRSVKRKAPRGKKKTIKRKAPIRKSTKRKKRKVSSKSVPLTVGTCRSRKFDHESSPPSGQTRVNASYHSFSSIGAKAEMFKMVAQAMLVHYMHRVGDYRANPSTVPADPGTDANPTESTWASMTFKFISHGIQSGADFQNTVVNGYTATLDAATAQLAAGLLEAAVSGRRLAQVTVQRSSSIAPECVLNDIYAGRNIIQFSCLAQLKLQNVTPADDSGAVNCDVNSAMNIHRNPLDGFAYNFRNAVPKLKLGYLLGKTQTQQIALRQLEWTYETNTSGVKDFDLGAQGPEFVAPPPNPSTIFSNSSGKDRIGIAPGGHKSFSMKEHFEGPINSFLDKYTSAQVALGATAGLDVVPPGGSCMLIGLKPKYRTSTSENIKLEIEHTYTYSARMTRGKLNVMPMQTAAIV
jgi:hypothetical protein